MAAKLNLLPRKEFEIVFETIVDGKPLTVKGQFGTWALKRLCDKLKCKLYELKDRFDPKDEKGDSVPAEVEVYMEFLLCAVEQKARLEGSPFSYTDVHAGMWIDELGGRDSENMLTIVRHSADEVKGEKKTEEKVA